MCVTKNQHSQASPGILAQVNRLIPHPHCVESQRTLLVFVSCCGAVSGRDNTIAIFKRLLLVVPLTGRTSILHVHCMNRERNILISDSIINLLLPVQQMTFKACFDTLYGSALNCRSKFYIYLRYEWCALLSVGACHPIGQSGKSA
jgi:hypothetical protein